jgi:hypothetical protein
VTVTGVPVAELAEPELRLDEPVDDDVELDVEVEDEVEGLLEADVDELELPVGAAAVAAVALPALPGIVAALT